MAFQKIALQIQRWISLEDLAAEIVVHVKQAYHLRHDEEWLAWPSELVLTLRKSIDLERETVRAEGRGQGVVLHRWGDNEISRLHSREEHVDEWTSG